MLRSKYNNKIKNYLLNTTIILFINTCRKFHEIITDLLILIKALSIDLLHLVESRKLIE